MKHSIKSMMTTAAAFFATAALQSQTVPFPATISLRAGCVRLCGQDVRNFILDGQAKLEGGTEAAMRFHTNASGGGYEALFRNGPIDGTRKTGSLSHVRNLYRSFAKDDEWFAFRVCVRERNIEISVNGMPVVRYTEGARPYRLPQYATMRLSHGDFAFEGRSGMAEFRDMVLTPLRDGVINPADVYPLMDEQTDPVMHLQQEDFPVINWHVHAKGGWTPAQAYDRSLADGINYGLAVNIYGTIKHKGDGGVGRMIETDAEAIEYLNGMRHWPFIHGFQGEGRKWTMSFTRESLSACDYIFTDSMTVVDRNRQLRLYRPDEMTLNGRSPEEWMDFYMDQIEKILTNEPADIYANPFYLPRELASKAEFLWTNERIDRVLDLLAKYRIALEINSRYRIPSHRAIRRAKARGIKFTLGTNNMDANIGRLEWALDAVKECGIAKEDMWFPTYSIRLSRPTVNYNTIVE